MTPKRLDAEQRDRFMRLAWPQRVVLLRTARYLTRRDDEAEELVQETLIKAMNAIDTFKEGTDIKAWLMTILRRTQIDRIRAAGRRPDAVSLDAQPSSDMIGDDAPAGIHDEQWDEPEQLLQRFEDQAIIDALKTLPDAIRWTLLLVDIEQMEMADAAGVLDVPIGTIKSRAHRGRGMLRDRLHDIARQRGWHGNDTSAKGANHEA